MATVNVSMEDLDDGTFVLKFSVNIKDNAYFPVLKVGCKDIKDLVLKITDFIHETDGLDDRIIGRMLEKSLLKDESPETKNSLAYWDKELQKLEMSSNALKHPEKFVAGDTEEK